MIPRAHCSVARGNEQENRTYCTKDGDFEEYGHYDPEAGKKGRRTDLEEIAARVAAGATSDEVAAEFPADYIRYHSGIDHLINLQTMRDSQEMRQVEILVLYGPTRIGKSYFVQNTLRARILDSGGTFYKCPSTVLHGTMHPWDHYQHQTAVFIDEFDFHYWPITHLNECLEGYPQQLPARYNNKYARWTHIIICTNIDPQTWYPGEPAAIFDANHARLAGNVFNITDRSQFDDWPNNRPAPMW